MLISDKKEENVMEKNLTTGSVFKNVSKYDGGIYWFADYAYDYRYDCRSCYGDNSKYCTGNWSG